MPQKILCRVEEIVPHGDRVYTVLLRPSTPLPRFLAGQFLHLALDPFRAGDFWPESRVFSIASSPSQRDLLRITYAVKGRFTTRMEAELAKQREVWVKMPYGEFLVDHGKDVCLIAGGTGITAFTAFLEDVPAEHPHEVHLFYGARRPELLIYRERTVDLTVRCPNAHVHLFAEESVEPGSGLHKGRTDLGNIWHRLPDPGAVTFYIAGPPSMIRQLAEGLKSTGVDDCRIIIDAWE